MEKKERPAVGHKKANKTMEQFHKYTPTGNVTYWIM